MIIINIFLLLLIEHKIFIDEFHTFKIYMKILIYCIFFINFWQFFLKCYYILFHDNLIIKKFFFCEFRLVFLYLLYIFLIIKIYNTLLILLKVIIYIYMFI
jgi:hypothetical protein